MSSGAGNDWPRGVSRLRRVPRLPDGLRGVKSHADPTKRSSRLTQKGESMNRPQTQESKNGETQERTLKLADEVKDRFRRPVQAHPFIVSPAFVSEVEKDIDRIVQEGMSVPVHSEHYILRTMVRELEMALRLRSPGSLSYDPAARTCSLSQSLIHAVIHTYDRMLATQKIMTLLIALGMSDLLSFPQQQDTAKPASPVTGDLPTSEGEQETGHARFKQARIDSLLMVDALRSDIMELNSAYESTWDQSIKETQNIEEGNIRLEQQIDGMETTFRSKILSQQQEIDRLRVRLQEETSRSFVEKPEDEKTYHQKPLRSAFGALSMEEVKPRRHRSPESHEHTRASVKVEMEKLRRKGALDREARTLREESRGVLRARTLEQVRAEAEAKVRETEARISRSFASVPGLKSQTDNDLRAIINQHTKEDATKTEISDIGQATRIERCRPKLVWNNSKGGKGPQEALRDKGGRRSSGLPQA